MDGPGERASKRVQLEGPTQSVRAEGHEAVSDRVGLDNAALPGSKTSARPQKPDAREPGDLRGASPQERRGRQAREGQSHKPYQPKASEESGAFMVPGKSPNMRVTPMEAMEGKDAANGKLAQRNAPRTQGRQSALTNLERVGQRAKKEREGKFDNLMCYLKVPLLLEAYQRLRPKAAPGVDGMTWSEYGVGLSTRLHELQDRIHSGRYHPQPVRRVHIPKGDGRTRPLGLVALEDKIVQQAVKMILEPIYESMFLGFSYGFRPGRSPHKALDALSVALGRKVNFVLDADIRSFYDTLDRGWLQRFIEHRIADRRMVRLLMKWVHAGVLEEGKFSEGEAGVPQGAIISPLLSNLYLHYALDLWVQQWRKRNARGEVYIVRYADDVAMGFQYEQEAQAMRKALAERLAKFNLELHPEKTRVIRFGRFAPTDCGRDGRKRPETFDFLGFTHVMGRSPRGGSRLIRLTSEKKRRAKLAKLREEMRRRRHDPVGEQQRWLEAVLRGHYNYYGVPGNSRAMKSFREQIRHEWHRQLQRRSQRARWSREKRDRFERRYPLPSPRITHPWPSERFYAP